jgi:hypothetical protein
VSLESFGLRRIFRDGKTAFISDCKPTDAQGILESDG